MIYISELIHLPFVFIIYFLSFVLCFYKYITLSGKDIFPHVKDSETQKVNTIQIFVSHLYLSYLYLSYLYLSLILLVNISFFPSFYLLRSETTDRHSTPSRRQNSQHRNTRTTFRTRTRISHLLYRIYSKGRRWLRILSQRDDSNSFGKWEFDGLYRCRLYQREGDCLSSV